MKKTGCIKGVMLLAIRIEAVKSILAHVVGALPALCFLGNSFFQWGNSVRSSKEGKIARG